MKTIIKKDNIVAGQSRQYWINAAKQFKWPIDFNDLQILVPECDLQQAEDDLMVKHFRNAGWHIQIAIVEYTKPFIAPVSNKPIFRPFKPIEQQPETEFKFNQKFLIQSTECELVISEISKKGIVLKYTNRNKGNINTTAENLQRQLKFGTWIKI